MPELLDANDAFIIRGRPKVQKAKKNRRKSQRRGGYPEAICTDENQNDSDSDEEAGNTDVEQSNNQACEIIEEEVSGAIRIEPCIESENDEEVKNDDLKEDDEEIQEEV